MVDTELFLGHTVQDSEPFHIDRDDFVTHGVVVGRTGSGKTGLVHVLIEEAVMHGVSAVVIDPKGDLTNLLLAFPGLTPKEFAPWVPPGKSPIDEAARWVQGLKNTGQSAARVAEWRNSAAFKVFTPGLAKTGQAINLLPDFMPPSPNLDRASVRERASHIVDSVLSAVGMSGDPLTDPSHVFLTEILLESWKRGKALPLEQWSGLIVNPPEPLKNVDGICIEDFFPQRDRMKLARCIVGFRRQAARWLEGTPLNMDSFLMPTRDGLPRVSIFTLRHLSEEDRMLFTSMFLSCLVEWMYRAPASGRLRALCVLDEASGYLPPHPYNPATKRPISLLLAQGRAQGLGMLIGTQNPNDLDYKALSNVGTWFLGGLRDRDMKRDLDAELRQRGVNTDALLKLPARSFLALTKDGKSQAFNTRWSLSYLRGPIDVEKLAAFSSNYEVEPSLDENMKVTGPNRPRPVLYGRVDVSFDLIDPVHKTLDVEVRYSTDDGHTWKRATPAPRSPSMRNLACSPTGVHHTFMWNSVLDLGLRFVPNVRIAVCVRGGDSLMLAPSDVCNNILIEEGEPVS